MKRLYKYTFLISFLTFLLFLAVLAQAESPYDVKFETPVVDKVGIFKLEELRKLEELLKKIEKETSNEIAVAVINDLGGKKIDDFSMEVANWNRVGKHIKNNGLLILLAIKDRKTRIEVGYGLESVITDPIAKSIMQENLIPNFKEGKYMKGFLEGINEMSKLLYKDDIKQFFSMKWDIDNFENFVKQYPASVQRCDALMFLGRFYEDLWNRRIIKSLGEDDRNKSIEYYKQYLKQCPNGIWHATVNYELSLVQSNKPDKKKYLIID